MTLTQPSADQSPGRPAKKAGKPKEKARVKPVALLHDTSRAAIGLSALIAKKVRQGKGIIAPSLFA
jgi:hypothetical protein